MGERFRDPADVLERLRALGYLADDSIASVVFLADRLEKPVLVEGPAGVGKTELAKTLAAITDSRLLRLQCYEGLDESRALYEWNYRKQLMRIQAGGGAPEAASDWKDIEADIFSEPYLLERPLLAAVRARDAVADRRGRPRRGRDRGAAARGARRVPGDHPGVGDDHRHAAPARGPDEQQHARAQRSAASPVSLPGAGVSERGARARDPARSHPGIEDRLALQVARVVRAARRLDLRKTPSIGESIDWDRALMALGHVDITQAALAETLPVLIKSRPDLVTAARELHAGERGS